MKNKKILVTTTTFPTFLKGDATPPFVWELSKRLASKEGLEIIVSTPHIKGTRTYEKRDGLKIYRYKYGFTSLCEGAILPNLKKNRLLYFQIPFFLAASFLNLKRLIKKEKIDIIHAHWIIPQGVMAALIKKSFDTPYVITSHGGDIYSLRGKILTKLKNFSLSQADQVTVVSQAIKKEVLSKINPKLKIKVIPMGVDAKLFHPNKRDNSIKKNYGITGPFLLFVGRLAEKKGVKYLIRAMPEIIKKFPKAKLMIIGTGRLEDELKNLTKKLNLEKNIIFMGAMPNRQLPKYYATADIFIGPSIQARGGDTEGLGLTFVEAGLSDCALVGSDIGGISDAIQDNKTGLLVQQKNSQEISNKTIKLLSDKPLINKIKKQVRKKMAQKFDWEIITKKYQEILK